MAGFPHQASCDPLNRQLEGYIGRALRASYHSGSPINSYQRIIGPTKTDTLVTGVPWPANPNTTPHTCSPSPPHSPLHHHTSTATQEHPGATTRLPAPPHMLPHHHRFTHYSTKHCHSNSNEQTTTINTTTTTTITITITTITITITFTTTANTTTHAFTSSLILTAAPNSAIRTPANRLSPPLPRHHCHHQWPNTSTAITTIT
ncbi:hypothetical protein E2C01_076411 [Portunus trituberculatus]|uniref:Uncharacterized protein n=1 Tax=Portunus trituberculatus TaxID=210409 RepID=A0A5B7IJQ5_PORTR|nr:hypothetical protein [Portunus trituberculatus]